MPSWLKSVLVGRRNNPISKCNTRKNRKLYLADLENNAILLVPAMTYKEFETLVILFVINGKNVVSDVKGGIKIRFDRKL